MVDVRELGGAAVDLFLGSRCVGCARPGPALCISCRIGLERLPFVCWPTPRPARLPTPYAVTVYDGAAKAAILAHKEHGALPLAGPLGRALALSVMAGAAAMDARAAVSNLVLVPPPSAPAVVRQRGHDPMARIVAAAVRSLRGSGVPAVAASPLRLARSVADQAGLTASDRAANLTGAFAVSPRRVARLLDQPVVVVDDVATTGATAAEASGALLDAGVQVIAVAVIAATARRGGAEPHVAA